MDRTGEYVVRLLTNGLFYADRSMTCGEKTFNDAVSQWENKGFEVLVLLKPRRPSLK